MLPDSSIWSSWDPLDVVGPSSEHTCSLYFSLRMYVAGFDHEPDFSDALSTSSDSLANATGVYSRIRHRDQCSKRLMTTHVHGSAPCVGLSKKATAFPKTAAPRSVSHAGPSHVCLDLDLLLTFYRPSAQKPTGSSGGFPFLTPEPIGSADDDLGFQHHFLMVSLLVVFIQP